MEGKAGKSMLIPLNDMQTSQGCMQAARLAGNPRGGVPERMVLVTFAGTKVTRRRADARIRYQIIAKRFNMIFRWTGQTDSLFRGVQVTPVIETR